MNIQQKVAAGGIILDLAEGRPSLLLILQTSHKGWGFPKGHLDRGEGPEEGALREVTEETGLLCTIIEGVGTTEYTFMTKKGKRVDKVVHWYLMTPAGEAEATHAHEILEMRWVPLPDVSSLLTYATDRELVERVMPRLQELAEG